ncbi:MAG: response regulator [Ignavibacteriae bacterium]|nr:response regulator [Ignavibacteriota bacterium]
MKTILLVEDERGLTDVLQMVFSKEGYHVYRMQRAEDALEFCLMTTPDIIISDIKLGGMDGLAFLQMVRGTERLRDVPFVVISATDNLSFIGIAKEFGATAYFSKPLDVDELVEEINNILLPQVKTEAPTSHWPIV